MTFSASPLIPFRSPRSLIGLGFMVAGAVSGPLFSALAAQGAPATPATTLPLKMARTHTFTTTRGTWMSVDVSPDGQTLVFDLLGDLYTLPIAGGKATRLTSGMAYDAQPRFSPDGRKVVFVSDRSGGENVWLLSLDLKDTTQLTRGNNNMYISPEFTPDGKYVIASRSGGLGGAAKLWMYHIDGGNGVPLSMTPTPAATQKQLGAAFGANGRYLWYATRTGDWQYNSIGPQYQLAVWDRETGRASQMTTRFGSGARPALSPDGTWLVYATRFETKTGLRIRNLQTQQEEWLAFPVQRDDMESRAPMDAYPGYSFTPDSKAIVVSYGGEFWRVPVDRSAPTKIPFEAEVRLEMGPQLKFAYTIDTAATFTARQIRDVQPSPDGKQLAFVSLDRVWVTTLPDGKPTRVSTGTVGEFNPVWSPDGKSLAYVTWEDSRGGQIMRADADGTRGWRTRTLSTVGGLYTDPVWSPSGTRIVATRAAAREVQEAGAAFFGPAAADLVWLPSTGGAATLIMPAGGLNTPHFTRDSSRIFAYSGSGGLQSFRWDGTDLKTHLRVTGPLPPNAGGNLDAALVAKESQFNFGGRAARPVGADMHLGANGGTHLDDAEPAPPSAPPAAMILMAPTGDQALAMVGMDFYTITVPQVGATAPTVSVADPRSASVPVKKLNTVGGEFGTWAADGRKIHWALGNALFTYDLDRAKVVDDSLKEDDRRKARLRADTTKAVKDSITRADSIAKADTTKKTPPGYKAAEMRIAVSAQRDVPRGTVVFRGAKAITMKDREIIDNADIVVRDQRIVAIGPRGSVSIPDGAKIIDVAGKVIMPGMVDTHYHPQWLTPNVHSTQTWQYLTTLAYGTTTTRDPQTATTDFLSYADRVESGDMIGPRIYTTGPGVFSSEPVRDLDHAREILTRYAKYYDTKTLKMYMSGNRQQRQWIIMAAKELGIMPTTEGGLDQKLNLTHGIDGYPGIEHTLPITPKYDDIFEWYKGTQVVNSPTLIVEYGGPFGEGWFYQSEDLLGDAKLRRFTHPVDFDTKVRRRGTGNAPGPAGFAVKEEYAMWQHAVDIKNSVERGARIGIGSHGQLQGLGMHWELWLVQSGGLSPHDALRSATIVGAEAIGLASEVGSLEPGKFADLLVLDKDPLENIRNSNTINMVMVNGRLFDGNTLDEVYPRQKPLTRQPWSYTVPSAAAGIRP
ncbi:amidohydrolase family protein [Gemmatimonas aurantiaca]|uniref:amidohydrolase family protein n=1 Tax=Gemmatimonas aurantiaca TaxID=173480 RepID=UPI00301E26AB